MMNSSQRASYPRTGRRGVPQQFPIKLYGMLESETEKAKAEADGMIRWSESGKAFHIEDSAVFAALVLPKYFRTSKFSSFQRNLNLYGFSKVKRGVDTDMYAHNSFIRGRPDLLVHLKKSKSSSSEESFDNCSRKNSSVDSYLSEQDMNMKMFVHDTSGMFQDNFSSSTVKNHPINSNIAAAIAGSILKICGSYKIPPFSDHFLNQHQSSVNPCVSVPSDAARFQKEDPAQIARTVSRSPTTTGSDDNSTSDEAACGSPFGKSRDGKLDLLTYAVNCLEDSRIHL